MNNEVVLTQPHYHTIYFLYLIIHQGEDKGMVGVIHETRLTNRINCLTFLLPLPDSRINSLIV